MKEKLLEDIRVITEKSPRSNSAWCRQRILNLCTQAKTYGSVRVGAHKGVVSAICAALECFGLEEASKALGLEIVKEGEVLIFNRQDLKAAA